MPRLYHAARDAGRLKRAGLWEQFLTLRAQRSGLPASTEDSFRELLPELTRREERVMTSEEIQAARFVPTKLGGFMPEDDLEMAIRAKQPSTAEVDLGWALAAVSRKKGGETVDLYDAPSLKALAILAVVETKGPGD